MDNKIIAILKKYESKSPITENDISKLIYFLADKIEGFKELKEFKPSENAVILTKEEVRSANVFSDGFVKTFKRLIKYREEKRQKLTAVEEELKKAITSYYREVRNHEKKHSSHKKTLR